MVRMFAIFIMPCIHTTTLRYHLGMDWTNLLGATAGLLTTAAFLPQVWLTWRTRSTQGISLGMYSIFTSGVFLWLVYGWMIGAWPIIITNGLTFILALFILVMKLRFG